MSRLSLILVCAIMGSCASHVDAETPPPTVGMPERIEQVVLPGPELEVRPLEDRHAPFVLRIVAVYPHGTDHRYDFEYYALEPGEYNLSDYLQRTDGTIPDDLPEIIVEYESILPEGQVFPTSLRPTKIRRFGGYRMWAAIAALVWVAGLFVLIFGGRKPKLERREAKQETLSPADRLRPLIRSARNGTLPPEERASLERAVMAFWRDELDLGDLPPAELSQQLKAHQDAGPMLRGLETWLHAPDGDPSVDLDELLRPIEDRWDAQPQPTAASQ